jgi:glycosyltransferase involved in cell wall biosynthesis
MKVLFLRTDYYGHVNVGGSFSHTLGFLRGLRSLGHEPIVVSSGPLPGKGDLRVHEIPYSPLYRNLPEVLSLAYNFTLVRKVRPVIDRERPDVLYHRHSEFNFASAMLTREFRLPLVLEFNGSELWVKKNWGRVYLETFLRNAERVQLSHASLIVVVSSVLKDQLVAAGVDPGSILVNPNGVDPDTFHPDIDGTEVRQRYGLLGKFVAGFVGTFGAWHGVEVLARAVKPTVAAYPNAHFLLIGSGTLQGEIERILKEDGMTHAVTLAGAIQHDQVPSYLAACDVLLSPHVQNNDGSVFFGSPTKLFEYMASGKPIVASPVGQIGEVLRDGESALFMQPGNPASLAENIVRLSKDDRLRSILGKNARKDAVDRFSWKQNADKVVRAITPFLEHKG